MREASLPPETFRRGASSSLVRPETSPVVAFVGPRPPLPNTSSGVASLPQFRRLRSLKPAMAPQDGLPLLGIAIHQKRTHHVAPLSAAAANAIDGGDFRGPSLRAAHGRPRTPWPCSALPDTGHGRKLASLRATPPPPSTTTKNLYPKLGNPSAASARLCQRRPTVVRLA